MVGLVVAGVGVAVVGGTVGGGAGAAIIVGGVPTVGLAGGAAGAAVAAAGVTVLGALTLGSGQSTSSHAVSTSSHLPKNRADVLEGVETALGGSSTLIDELAAHAVVLDHTVQDADLTHNCWTQLLTTMPDAPPPNKKVSIATLTEEGIIAAVDSTTIVGQNGRRFQLCPVFREPQPTDSSSGGALEWIGMHAVPL